MPFCPNCRSEFRAGFEVCRSCDDTPLVEELTVMVEIEPGEETAPVSIARDDHDVPIIELDGETYEAACIHPFSRAIDFKRILEAEKIASVIFEIPKLVLPGNQPAYELHVRAAKLEDALTVLKREWEKLAEYNESMGELSAESCPACGADVPMDVEECPECGLVVGFGEADEEDDEDYEALEQE